MLSLNLVLNFIIVLHIVLLPVAPKQRKPPKERTLLEPTSTNEEVDYPSEEAHATRETGEMLLEPTRTASQETSSDNLQLDSPGALNGGLPNSANESLAASDTQRDCAELKKQLADVERRYAMLQEHHTNAKNAIQNLKKQVRKLESKADNFAKNSGFLNADQISALSKTSTQGHTWSVETVKQGLQIKFACGTTGYETLRKLGYPLPSSRTLARRIQGLRFLPGILQEVFDVMKCKAESMEDVEKDCVLFLDEMEIAAAFELDRSEDILLGGTTLPSKPEEPANKALVFMLGGINQRWKQVIGYEFTGKHVDGALLKDYVLDIVRRCNQISLRVRAVTCDMGSANRGMWREFGFSSHRNSTTVCSIPHPCLDGKELFFTADAAHVLKNLRGQLLSSGEFTLSEATVLHNKLPSPKVKLEHIKAVVDFDAERELKVAPALSKVHVSDGHFTKMKVGIALQFFREAAPAIRFWIKEGRLEAAAETTAWFMALVSKWYALMSSRHPSLALSHRNMEKYNAALKTLRLAVETIQGMHMGATSQWKPSQAGLLISTTVVLRLQEVFLGDERYEFVLTSRLLQDCLENLFSVVRLMKPVPTAYDLKCALRLVSVSQFLHTPRATSYELDDREYLVDLLAQAKKQCSETFSEEIDDSEVLFLEGLTSTECRILYYLGGFILKSVLKHVPCSQCKDALLGAPNNEYASLTLLKEYVSDGHNLIYPSSEVIRTLMNYEEHFTGVTTWCTNSIHTMKSPLKSLTEYLAKIDRPCLNTCADHREAICKMLIATYARLRLRVHLRQYPATRAEGHGSKTCAGVSLP